ncbi:hypothetical protein [Candidatus Pyrohabitans sp.]
MPTCEICGEEVEEIYSCGVCGYHFCANCGDPASGECEFCMEEEEL